MVSSGAMAEPLTPRHVLEWHLAAGVDEAIGEVPIDRFAAKAPPTADTAATAATIPAPPVPAPTPVPRAPPAAAASTRSSPSRVLFPDAPGKISSDEAVRDAVAAAAAATDAAALRAALETFEGCALHKTATNLVFYDGNPHGQVMFVGEAPGADEDRLGLPFVGQSGQLLDRMLASIGLDRTQACISNTVFWRPPGNRTPTTQEMAVCLPFLERLIELVDPRILVTLGGPAAKAVLGENAGVGQLRGRWFLFSTPRLQRPIETMAMYHPAYLLRSPSQKREAWRDLLTLKRRLAEIRAEG